MSKKMMKRSLTLGALMAFVITGQAWAADDSNNNVVVDVSQNVVDVYGGNSADGAANYNTVTIDGATVTGLVRGGKAYIDAIGNEVTIGSGSEVAGSVKGGSAQDHEEDFVPGVAEHNKVKILGESTVHGSVYGAENLGFGIENGSVSENEVQIIGSTVNGDVSGGVVHWAGYDITGKANSVRNKVTVENGIINSYISGGHSSYGDAIENVVTINGEDTVIKGQVFGGRAQYAEDDEGSVANGNTVIINNGTINGRVFGGAGNGVEGTGNRNAKHNEANGNTVEINGGTINKEVYGGNSGLTGVANENTVTITGGTINNKVYGGYGFTEANGNTVEITGGTFSDSARLYGGSAYGDAKLNTVNIVGVTLKNNIIAGVSQNGGNLKGDASENKVVIEDSIIYGSVYAGDVAEDHNDDGAANNNEILIKNSQLFDSGKYKENSHVYAGCNNGDGDANGNKLTIISSQFEAGMYMSAGFSGFGNANENELIIDGADTSIEGVAFGGRAQIDGNANLNKVTVLDGRIKGRIYGGAANETYNEWYEEDSVEANNNEVVIEGGSIDGAVYGGYAGEKPGDGYVAVANENIVTISGGTVSGNVYGGYSEVGTADNNTVNISGTADITNASLFGSNKSGTGNTLNIAADWSNSNVKSVNNFNEINIEEAKWGTPVVEVESLTLVDTTVNVDTVRVADGDETFAPGKSSAVITSNSVISGEVAGGKVNVFKGVATIYEATVEKSEDNKSVEIQLGGEETAEYNAYVMNPQVLVIGESRAAATAFTNQGSELIETGLDALARDKAEDTKVFASVYGNTSEYATGSEVKVNGWSGIVGVGKTNANGLTVGAFFENGEGNYRTYNDVNGEFMRGDGEACYNGGGFIVRKDNANGVYAEASLRAGNLQNELRNAVRGSEGLTGYDIDTFYYGAHVGIGKVIARGNEGDSIDVYGKFIYTHHDSEDFTINGGDFHFDSVDSERLRLGFRINEVQNTKLAMYYGAAWEYEFNGDSNYTVVRYDLSTPSLGGSTVIGEIGAHYKASDKWSIDLNGRAYVGQREGFSGSVQANYAF